MLSQDNPTPSGTCVTNLYRRIKRRVGRSLKRAHGKRKLVTPRKQTAHKLPGVEGSPSGLKRIPSSLYGRNEVGPPVCLTLEDPHLVHKKPGNPQSSTYPRSSKCHSRQTIQTGSDHSNRMVPQSRGIQGNMQPVAQTQVDLFATRYNNKLPQFISPVPDLSGGCSQSVLGGTGPLCLSTSGHLGQSGGEVTELPVQQNNSDCPRVAQHALILGSSYNVKSDPAVSAQHTQLSVSTIQSGPSQEPVEFEPTCLAPRASAIKQGFSEAVAARIEAPQRGSTRSVYEAKWSIFTKWCLSNQVDFRAPPLKAIADFLLYLFRKGNYNHAQ